MKSIYIILALGLLVTLPTYSATAISAQCNLNQFYDTTATPPACASCASQCVSCTATDTCSQINGCYQGDLFTAATPNTCTACTDPKCKLCSAAATCTIALFKLDNGNSSQKDCKYGYSNNAIATTTENTTCSVACTGCLTCAKASATTCKFCPGHFRMFGASCSCASGQRFDHTAAGYPCITSTATVGLDADTMYLEGTWKNVAIRISFNYDTTTNKNLNIVSQLTAFKTLLLSSGSTYFDVGADIAGNQTVKTRNHRIAQVLAIYAQAPADLQYNGITSINDFITNWLGFVNTGSNYQMIDGDDVLSVIAAVNNMLYALTTNYAAINTANPTLTLAQRSTMVANILSNLNTLTKIFVQIEASYGTATTDPRIITATASDPETYFFDSAKTMQLLVKEINPATTTDITIQAATGLQVVISSAAVAEIKGTSARVLVTLCVFNYNYNFFSEQITQSFENNLVILSAFGADSSNAVTQLTDANLSNAGSIIKFIYTLGTDLNYKYFSCLSNFNSGFDSDNQLTQIQSFTSTANTVTCTQSQLTDTSLNPQASALQKICRDGYYLVASTGNCAACTSDASNLCATCSGSATTCLTCLGGYNAIGGKCFCSSGNVLSLATAGPCIATTAITSTVAGLTTAPAIQLGAYEFGTGQKTEVLSAITTFLATASNVASLDILNQIVNALAKSVYQISGANAGEYDLIAAALENLNLIQTSYTDKISIATLEQIVIVYSNILDKISAGQWYNNRYYPGQSVNQKFLAYFQTFIDKYANILVKDAVGVQNNAKYSLWLTESPNIVFSFTSFPNSLLNAIPDAGYTINAKYAGNLQTGDIQYQFTKQALQKITINSTSPAFTGLLSVSMKGFGYQIFDDAQFTYQYPSSTTPMYARVYSYDNTSTITSGTYRTQEITGLNAVMNIGFPTQTGTPSCGTLNKFTSATQSLQTWSMTAGAAAQATSTYNCGLTALDQWFSMVTSTDCFPGTFLATSGACTSCSLAGCTSCMGDSCNLCNNFLQPIAGTCGCASGSYVQLNSDSTRDYGCTATPNTTYDALNFTNLTTSVNYVNLEKGALTAYNQSLLETISSTLSTLSPNTNATDSGVAAAFVSQTAFTLRAIGINPNFQNSTNSTCLCNIVTNAFNVITAILGQNTAQTTDYEQILEYISSGIIQYWITNSAAISTYSSTCQTNFKNTMAFLQPVTQNMAKLLQSSNLIIVGSQFYRKKYGNLYVNIQLMSTSSNFNQTYSPEVSKTGKYYLYFNMTSCAKFNNGTIALTVVQVSSLPGNLKFGPFFFNVYNLTADSTYVDLSAGVCADDNCAQLSYSSPNSEQFQTLTSTSSWTNVGSLAASKDGWVNLTLKAQPVGKGQWFDLYQAPQVQTANCENGFFKNSTGGCSLCTGLCATCSESATKCVTCLNGRTPTSDSNNCSCGSAAPYLSDTGACINATQYTTLLNTLLNGTTISTLPLANLTTIVGVATQNSNTSTIASLVERTSTLASSSFTKDNAPQFLKILQSCLYDAPSSMLQQSWDNLIKITSQFTSNPATLADKNQALSVLQIIGKTIETSALNSTAGSTTNYQERSRSLIAAGVQNLLSQTDLCTNGGSTAYKMTDNIKGSLTKVSASGNFSLGSSQITLGDGVWNSSSYNSTTSCNVIDQVSANTNFYSVADPVGAKLYSEILSVRMIQQSTSNKTAVSVPSAQTFSTNAQAVLTFGNFNGTSNYVCKYWSTSGWQTTGVVYSGVGSTARCNTTHFTDFAIVENKTTTTTSTNIFSDKINVNVLFFLAILSIILALMN